MKKLIVFLLAILCFGWTHQNGTIEGGGVSPYPVTKVEYLYAGGGFVNVSGIWNDTVICGSAFSATASNYLSFEYVLPFDYSLGTDIDIYLDWGPTSADVGNVVWKLHYDLYASGGTMHKITVGGFETVTNTWATDGTAYKIQNDKITTIAGPAANTSLISGIVERLGADGGDSYVGVAKVYGVYIVYTAAQFGASARP